MYSEEERQALREKLAQLQAEREQQREEVRASAIVALDATITHLELLMNLTPNAYRYVPALEQLAQIKDTLINKRL